MPISATGIVIDVSVDGRGGARWQMSDVSPDLVELTYVDWVSAHPQAAEAAEASGRRVRVVVGASVANIRNGENFEFLED